MKVILTANPELAMSFNSLEQTMATLNCVNTVVNHFVSEVVNCAFVIVSANNMPNYDGPMYLRAITADNSTVE